MRIFCIFVLVLALSLALSAQPSRHHDQGQQIQSLQIYPANATLRAGESLRFTAVALDLDQCSFTPRDLRWMSTGGRIDNEGNFTADDDYGRIMVTVSARNFQSTAVVQVKGYGKKIVRVEISPKYATLNVGENVQFEAVAYDMRGRTIPAQFQWESDGGSVDHRGFFRAGMQAGRFRLSARELTSGITDEVAVQITGSHHPHPPIPPVPVPPDPYPTQGRIVVSDFDTGGNMFQPKVKMTVQVFGQGATTVRLFSVSADGAYTELDSASCQNGATVNLKSKFENFRTRYFEVRLFDHMNRVIATQRKNR